MVAPEVHVTAVEDAGFEVYLEPEGWSYRVAKGQSVRLRFPHKSGPVEVSWSTTGLIIARDVNCHDMPQVLAEDGRALDW